MAELLQAALSNTASQYVKAAKTIPKAIKGLVAGAKIVATRKRVPGERSLRLGLAPKTIFNASITNQRSYVTLSLPLGELKALGKRVGGTVNTVVMAMCASALRRYLIERDALPKKSLIASVPVSLRSADDSSMNNQVSMIRVDLATISKPTGSALQGHPRVLGRCEEAWSRRSNPCSGPTCRSPARRG